MGLTLTSEVKFTDPYQKTAHKSRKRRESTMATNDANDSTFVLKFELALYILMIWFKHFIFSYRQAYCPNYPLTLAHQHKLLTFALKQGKIFSLAGMLTASQGLEEIATGVYNTD